MDYAERVVAFLSESDDRREVMLAPHAPPVHKRAGAVVVAIEAVLDDRDVEDTLFGVRVNGSPSASISMPRRCNACHVDGAHHA